MREGRSRLLKEIVRLRAITLYFFFIPTTWFRCNKVKVNAQDFFKGENLSHKVVTTQPLLPFPAASPSFSSLSEILGIPSPLGIRENVEKLWVGDSLGPPWCGWVGVGEC